MVLTVYLSQAIICTSLQCWPVLLGKDTSKFVHQTLPITQRYTSDPGYGGDVLKFFENEKAVYAIHRTWNGKPAEKRDSRLRSNNVRDRIITNGCINVADDVYAQLTDYTTVTFKP